MTTYTPTPTQSRLIQAHLFFCEQNGRAPSLSELANQLGKSRAAVHQTIKALQTKGLDIENLDLVRDVSHNVISNAEFEVKLDQVMEILYTTFLDSLNETLENSRRHSITLLSTLIGLAHTYKGRLLNFDQLVNKTERNKSVQVLLKLSPINLSNLTSLISEKSKEVIFNFILLTQNLPFHQTIELMWPMSMSYSPLNKEKRSSFHRRVQGVYLTPKWLARRTVEFAVLSYLEGQGFHRNDLKFLTKGEFKHLKSNLKQDLLASLEEITIIDPACGIGTFLSEAFQLIVYWIKGLSGKPISSASVRTLISYQLYGVDRDPLAVAITNLVLYFHGQSHHTEDLDFNIVCGDSLLGKPFHGTWQHENQQIEMSVSSLDWSESFPQVKNQDGFDVVVGNPPWERIKLLSREYFEHYEPELSKAPTTAMRHKLMVSQGSTFEIERRKALDYVQQIRESGYYPNSAVGDINLYQLFIERAIQIANQSGSIGLIIPSSFVTGQTLSNFFKEIRQRRNLVYLFDFENRAKLFSDVDGRFRFSICVMSNNPTSYFPAYGFFLNSETDLDDENRQLHIDELTLKAINPNTQTLPIVRSSKDLDILAKVHSKLPVIEYDNPNKNTLSEWKLTYKRLFDMSNDSGKFVPFSADLKSSVRRDGLIEVDGELYARLYEGRMIDIYDHRAASCIERIGNYRRPASSLETSLEEYRDPNHLALPRYLIDLNSVARRFDTWKYKWSIGFMDIGSSTNRRTMIASVLPLCAAGNKVPLLLPGGGAKEAALLLSNINSFVFDYILRQKLGNITLNWYIIRQCPLVPISLFDKLQIRDIPLKQWLISRILELTYTASDLENWATDLQYSGATFEWNLERRRELQVQIDALFFKLYDLNSEEIEHVLDSFPIVKKEELKKYGDFRIKKEILDYWNQLNTEMQSIL